MLEVFYFFFKSKRIACIDVETKKVTCLNNGLDELNSCNMLSLNDDWICAAIQGYKRKPELMIAKLPQRGYESKINWIFTLSSTTEEMNVSVDLLKFRPIIADSVYRKLNQIIDFFV